MTDERVTDEMVETTNRAYNRSEWGNSGYRAMRAALESSLPPLLAELDALREERPALVAEVERLRAEHERRGQSLRRADLRITALTAERDTARAEVESARAVLAAVDAYARGQAIKSHRDDWHEERRWLDMLAIIEQSAALADPAAAAGEGESL